MRSAYTFEHIIHTAFIQLRHNYLLHYTQSFNLDSTGRPNQFNIQESNKEKSTYSGNITPHAKRRIQQAIHKLLIYNPPRKIINPITKREESFTVNFITLTIPAIKDLVSADRGYKLLLAPFLRVMRAKYGLQDYIWKAELQERGQLHYHLTTNTWIHHTAIKDEWNYLIRKHSLMDEYIKRYKRDCPNSTDVHKVYKIKDLASYLSKYISKDSQNTEALNGKIWDCSLSLKKSKLPVVEIDNCIGVELLEMLTNKEFHEVTTEFCTLIKPNKRGTEIDLPPLINQLRNEFRKNKFSE